MLRQIFDKIVRREKLSDQEYAELMLWADSAATFGAPSTTGAATTTTGTTPPPPPLVEMIQEQVEGLLRSRVWIPKLDDFSSQLGLMLAGEFRSGNGDAPGDGFTGGRFGYPGFTYGGSDYFLAGVSNDVLQIGMSLSDGKLYAGAGAVVLSSAGIVATAGTIGGWVLGANTLTADSGTIGLSSEATGANDIRIWVGHATPLSAPFIVYETGQFVATSATITGSITATSGSIGGWNIDGSGLIKHDGTTGIKLDGDTPYILVGRFPVGGTHIVIDGANQRIRSSNFATGATGFNIAADTGDAEFNNITARGELKTFLLTSSNQMAVAGNIMVSKDAGKLGADVSSGATTVNFGKALTVGNWIKIQGPDSAGTASLEWMLIGSLVSGTTYNVTRNVDGSGANAWLKDTPFVVIGANGDSRIELVAGASGSIQLITQGATWNTQTVQASMSTTDGAIVAGGGDVVMDNSGIWVANQQGDFGFKSTGGTKSLSMYSDGLDFLVLANQVNGKGVRMDIDTTGGNVVGFYFQEDGASAETAQLHVEEGTNGAKISAGGGVAIWSTKDGKETVFNDDSYDIDFRIEGATDTSLFKLDAGLDAIGMGSAAESGYKLKVTGSAKITDGLEWGGWAPGTGTWSYSSADSPTFVISINADVTALIGVGDRIKLTQTTAKYFIVTAVGAFGGGVTLVTVYGGTDYTLANAAITSPYYSHAKAPLGFPLSPIKWTVEVTDTTGRSTSTPTQNTWYNATSISVPIGVWLVSYSCSAYGNGTIATPVAYTTLSTANNSESDADFTAYVAITITGSGADKYCYAPIARQKYLALASKTTYYQNYKTNVASQSTVGLDNASAKNIIRAVCAYL